MGLFDFLRRQRPPASFAELRAGPPNPVFVGDFLVCCFVDRHFGISDADLEIRAEPLPATVRELAAFWVNLYLCWVLRTSVRAKYGDPFFEAAFEAVRARLALGEHLVHGTAGLADVLNYWFEQLDRASSRLGQVADGIPLPMEYFAALCFLALTPESPLFGKSEIPPGLDLDVAEILQRAKTSALPLIQSLTEVGGPIKPGAV